MSNHIGLLLSLVLFTQIFLVCLDLVKIQTLNSKLVTESNYVNALIQKNREIDEEVFTYVRENLNGKLTCVTPCHGEDKKIIYKITITYKSIYNPKEKEMSIQRSVLLGYTL